jgi:uncharacterized protein (DUF427 family)
MSKPSNEAIERARAAWTYRGQHRPPCAVDPAPGQESVWDYPRPPAFVPDGRTVEIYADSVLIAQTARAIRVLETGSPPTFYIPPEAVEHRRLERSTRRTFCEWKGEAEYFHVLDHGRRIADAMWRYPHADGDAAVIAGWLSCYPSRLRCLVAGERVRSQAGGFYGGWITDEVVGPFKGEPGTSHW